jgi:uncharacterized membrane-anchored protein
MIQFYFLSILFNALTGYLLTVKVDEEEVLEESFPGVSLKSETLRLVLGILTMLTGLLKILSSVQGDVPVVGDLVPALAGLGSGFVLVIEYYRSRSGTESGGPVKIEGFLVKRRKLIGFIALVSAVLHFLFPQVLLL